VPIKPLMDTSTGVTRDQDTIRGRRTRASPNAGHGEAREAATKRQRD
jgi:IS4 transposase